MTDQPATTLDGRRATAADVVHAAERLRPTIEARADAIEAERELPADLLGELVAAGCFRVLLPASHGGLEADLVTALRVHETLARADASTGWLAMIGGSGWCDLVALPRATFDQLFAADPRIAGVFNPQGSVAPVDGAYRIEGRWAFASGCRHADWIYLNAVEGFADGAPLLRAAVLPADEVAIEDTWHVSGLRGTGSHHVRADGVMVPGERTFRPLADPPCVESTAARVPPPAVFSLGVASVALGVARGALDDVVALAQGKVPFLAAGPLAGSPAFQLDLAGADTALRAARSLLHETAEAAWANAASGTEPTLEHRARVRAAAAWVTERAVEVVDTAHRAAGGTAVYAGFPLERRHRDVHTLRQHFLVRRDTMITAGAILAGQTPELVVF